MLTLHNRLSLSVHFEIIHEMIQIPTAPKLNFAQNWVFQIKISLYVQSNWLQSDLRTKKL